MSNYLSNKLWGIAESFGRQAGDSAATSVKEGMQKNAQEAYDANIEGGGSLADASKAAHATRGTFSKLLGIDHISDTVNRLAITSGLSSIEENADKLPDYDNMSAKMYKDQLKQLDVVDEDVESGMSPREVAQYRASKKAMVDRMTKAQERAFILKTEERMNSELDTGARKALKNGPEAMSGMLDTLGDLPDNEARESFLGDMLGTITTAKLEGSTGSQFNTRISGLESVRDHKGSSLAVQNKANAMIDSLKAQREADIQSAKGKLQNDVRHQLETEQNYTRDMSNATSGRDLDGVLNLINNNDTLTDRTKATLMEKNLRLVRASKLSGGNIQDGVTLQLVKGDPDGLTNVVTLLESNPTMSFSDTNAGHIVSAVLSNPNNVDAKKLVDSSIKAALGGNPSPANRSIVENLYSQNPNMVMTAFRKTIPVSGMARVMYESNFNAQLESTGSITEALEYVRNNSGEFDTAATAIDQAVRDRSREATANKEFEASAVKNMEKGIKLMDSELIRREGINAGVSEEAALKMGGSYQHIYAMIKEEHTGFDLMDKKTRSLVTQTVAKQYFEKVHTEELPDGTLKTSLPELDGSAMTEPYHTIVGMKTKGEFQDMLAVSIENHTSNKSSPYSHAAVKQSKKNRARHTLQFKGLVTNTATGLKNLKMVDVNTGQLVILPMAKRVKTNVPDYILRK